MYAVWLSDSGRENFDIALRHGIWGMNSEPHDGVSAGQTVIFGAGAGSPRVTVEEFVTRRPNLLHIAVATSGVYQSESLLWTHPTKTFPYRFSFDLLGTLEAPADSDAIAGIVTPEVMAAFHWSANQYSTPRVLQAMGSQVSDWVRGQIAYEGELETASSGVSRREQPLLRRILIPSGSGQCALCGDTYESGFLIAAHIKPRYLCSREEKLDIPAIGMAACLFGCDSAFEKGYLAVDRGRLWLSTLLLNSSSMAARFQAIEGREIKQYSLSKDYFDWHFAQKAKR